MENNPVFSNRLDESNGIVENVLEMKAKKTPWFLRFAPKAKGIVSFVQNLLSPLTRKEGVRGGQLSAFFQSAAAIVVGIGLLTGSNAEVQAACDPPVFDVCTHKFSGSWLSSGYFAVDIQFEGQSDELYEVVWNGYKKLYNRDRRRMEYTYDAVSDPTKYSGGWEQTISYEKFWWDPSNSWNNYGCSIYEGHWDWNNLDSNGFPTWVRDRWVAGVDFYAYQEAAYVSINSSALDFSMSTYYCTILWEPNLPGSLIRHGYYHGYWQWIGNYAMWPKYGGGWYYHGDAGSPRFHYEASCSVDVYPPPHPTNPPSRR